MSEKRFPLSKKKLPSHESYHPTIVDELSYSEELLLNEKGLPRNEKKLSPRESGWSSIGGVMPSSVAEQRQLGKNLVGEPSQLAQKCKAMKVDDLEILSHFIGYTISNRK